tara:strand:+ start:1635 stop:1808 length:174 start_codon:yes stop_codon:yes gene_type:complete
MDAVDAMMDIQVHYDITGIEDDMDDNPWTAAVVVWAHVHEREAHGAALRFSPFSFVK